MPTYPYKCPACGKPQDIIKKMADIDNLEDCIDCRTAMEPKHRLVTGGDFLYAAVEDSEYNVGLGCVTHGRKHRAQLAKDRGMEEIGNSEDPRKTWDRLEKDREQKSKRGWDEILEDKICLSR